MLLSITAATNAQTQTASITVNAGTSLGQVNTALLSSAMARSSNIEGVWDLNENRPFPEMVAYARGMGMKYLRYQILENIDWKTAVGLSRTAEFGLPEYLQFCEAAGAIPIIVVSEKNGTAEDAADLVEYLNAPDDGSNPNGGTDWAQVRAGDGRPEPWNVVWFEYGNESWAHMPANIYVINYIDYQNAMKQVSPDIKLGAVLGNYFWDNPRGEWNAEIIPGTGSVADFYIIHTYIPNYHEDCCNAEDSACINSSFWSIYKGISNSSQVPICGYSAHDVFTSGLSGVNDQFEHFLNQLNNFIYELTGHAVGIAVTEFNGHFVQHWYFPAPYRHSLGDALINAEFIRQFMHADNIIMSNFWQFSNDYWGMVVGPNSFQNEQYKAFGMRPNYYPFYFYHNYFGDILIEVDGVLPSYYEYGLFKNGNLDLGFGVQPANADQLYIEEVATVNQLNGQWNNYPVTGVSASVDNNVLTVQFNGTDNVDYIDSQKSVHLESNTAYRLSGLIKTSNLGDGEGAYLAVQEAHAINLVTNSGFEDDLSGWILHDNSDWTFDVSNPVLDTEAYSGSQSAKINFYGTSDVNFYHIVHETIDVQPGTTYTLEGYIKTVDIEYDIAPAPAAPTEWYGIMLSVADANGCEYGSLYTCWSLLRGLKGTHAWTRVSKTFTTASYTNQLKVLLRRMSGGGAISGEAWWDDIRLSQKIVTDSLRGTSDWRYVYVDFDTGQLGNPSELAVIAGGNARSDGIENKSAMFKDISLRKITQKARNGIVPYLSVNASKSADGKKVYMIVVNKHMTESISSVITLNDFTPHNARAWVLNDWSADSKVYAHNESSNDVYAKMEDLGAVSNIVNYSFPAHSLTALVIYTDSDGDGYSSETDCNDDDVSVNPGTSESCDGVDNDCNGDVDDIPYFIDTDGDGYGNPAGGIIACNAPEGYVSDNSDCDDSNAFVSPVAEEICDDGLDNDCDGTAALCSPANWYDGGDGSIWGFRLPVSIQAGMTVADLDNFPLLLKIDDPEHPVFTQARADGDDIVFIDSQGVKLDHELEKFASASGELVAWVRVPVLTASGDTIYMYYGNDNAMNQQNTQSVWDGNYIMIQHLSETSGRHYDSTANGNNSSLTVPVNVMTQGGTATAKTGGADEFDGIDDSITVTDADSLDNIIDPVNKIAGPITIGAWIKPEGNLAAYWQKGIMSKKGGGGKGYRIVFDHNSNCYSNSIEVTYGNGSLCSAADSIVLNQWQHIAYVYDSANHFLYINGEPSLPAASYIPTSNENVTNDLLIGKWGNSFEGFIDEVRISNIARSAEWIQAEYKNQNSPENYVQFAAQEIFCTDIDGDGYAPDGGLCGVMDCNDSDVTINPATVWYKDTDDDGYSDGTAQVQCLRPFGYKLSTELTAVSGDLNDNSPDSYPGAVEICDGLDNNYDGQIDEGFDTDGDGYTTCGGDCDDNNAAINPGTTEVPYNDIDDDCGPATTDDPVANIAVNVNQGPDGKLSPIPVNRGVFGAVTVGYYREGTRLGTYHIDGAGVWDTLTNKSDDQMVEFAKDTGISFSRFPGGGVHEYDWRRAIGPQSSRLVINGGRINFGISEFLQNCNDIGSTPVIVVSDFLGNAADAANLVKYLNSPCDTTTNCTAAVPEDSVCAFQSERLNAYISNPSVIQAPSWPQLRVCDKYALGRTDLDQPWDVIWFEYGNETNSDWSPETYITNYLVYREAMQNVDNRIKLGVVNTTLHSDYEPDIDWFYKVVLGTGHVADFFIRHNYALKVLYCPTADANCPLGQDVIEAEDLFKIALASTDYQMKDDYKMLNDVIRDLTGRSDIPIPIAVTEFNGGFAQNYPVPYRHTLGTALVNADHIRQMMHADNIAMANYHHFANETWGMVTGPDYNDPSRSYSRYPNYYLFQLYKKFFGDILVNADVDSAAYEQFENRYTDRSSGVQRDDELGPDLLSGQLWAIGQPCDPQEPGIYPACEEQNSAVLTVKFNGSQDVDYSHSVKTAALEPGSWYRLSGFVNTTTGLTSSEGIYLAVQSGNNLVINGGFENDFTNWYEAAAGQPSGASRRIDHEEDHSGNKSTRIDFDGSQDVNYWETYQKQAVDPATTYMIEGYVKTDGIAYSSPSSYYGMGILAWAEGGTADDVWYSTPFKQADNWTYISKQFITPPDTFQVGVELRRFSGGGYISGTAWYDDIKLTNKASTWRVTDTHGEWSKFTVDFKNGSTTDGKVFVGRNTDGLPIAGIVNIEDVKLQKLTPKNYGSVKYLSVNASKSADGKTVYLMVVNKNITSDIASTINIDNFTPSTAQAWVLNGPSIDSTNKVSENVGVTYDGIGPVSNGFSYIFPAHSLTAIKIMDTACTDNDGDEYYQEGICGVVDCDDNNPGLTVYNYYLDSDGDGYGVSGQSIQSCVTIPPSGYAAEGSDCNDGDPLINPGLTETPYNGKDDDCSSDTRDDDLDRDGYAIADDCNDNKGLEHQGQTWYRDTDDDDYSDGTTIVSCARPAGYKTAFELIKNYGDCNDGNADIHEGVNDAVCDGIDDNCDGTPDDGYEPTPAICGTGACAASGQIACQGGQLIDTCTPGQPSTEICDAVDNDCDGQLDEDFPWFQCIGQYRRTITIKKEMLGTEPGKSLDSFPVLLKIADQNDPVFQNAQTDGDDILFTLSDGYTKLAHEIEKFDPLTGELIAWVRLPVLSSDADTDIYMFYGNSSAPEQQSKERVWGNNYVLVQHLGEMSGHHFDSTVYGNDSNAENVEAQGTNGKIGDADEFGTDSYITLPDKGNYTPLDLAGNSSVAYSAWVYARSPGENNSGGILSKSPNGTGSGYRFGLDASNCGGLVITRSGNWGGFCDITSVTMNDWDYVVYVYDSATGNHYLYIDGVLKDFKENSPQSSIENSGDFKIGVWAGSSFDGFIDEVRISNIVRSDDWIAAEYNNQNSPENYIQFAAQEIFCTDIDGDGYAVEGGVCGVMDCNDSDDGIYPGGPPVRVNGVNYYSTLQGAYDAASGGSIIEMKAASLAGDLNLNLNKTLTLTGGYDCSYSSVTGITTIIGNVSITSGKVTIENMEIQ